MAKRFLVCREIRFSREDRFAVKFFRNKEFYITEDLHPSKDGGTNVIQTHSGAARPELTSFIIGILLRWELFALTGATPIILGSNFERLRQKYLAPPVSARIGMGYWRYCPSRADLIEANILEASLRDSFE